MTDSLTPKPCTRVWLGDYLDTAVERNLCVRVRCTTCAAMEFRSGLYSRALAALGIAPPFDSRRHDRRAMEHIPQARNDTRVRLELARQLALLAPDHTRQRQWLDAIHLIFCELWWAAGEAIAERDYQPIVEGTWAGSILCSMQAHSRRREAERRAYEAFNSPEAVQARRDAKRKLKQQAQAERLARKKERDRLWFEKHPRPDGAEPQDTDRKE